MSGLTDMTLKILYTLDDGTTNRTSYLARSKKPQRVRVATIPNPNLTSCNNSNSNRGDGNNDADDNNGSNSNTNNNGINNNDCGVSLKVGAVSLSTILDEIYINSPEVLENNNIKFDYNVYYRDICEMNEPLVSLGLLSKIRSKLFLADKKKKDKSAFIDGQTPETEFETSDIDEEDSDYEDDDDMVVTGRVCSNFSALLRRSYSNSHKKNSKKNVSIDTLEIKLKFSRIIQSRKPIQSRPKSTHPSINIMMAKRQNTIVIEPSPSAITPNNNATAPISSQYAIPSLPTKPINKIMKPKRQTNPKPAPKAKRTQSLPVWNMDTNTNNSRKVKGSIAHKIFMADKLNEGSSPTASIPKPQVFTYEINALQRDNIIQQQTVDDSVSKRFDFMNNKPLGNSSSPLNDNVSSMTTTPATISTTPVSNTTPATTVTTTSKPTKAKRTKSVRKPRAKSVAKPSAGKRRRQSTTTATTTTRISLSATTTPLSDLITQLDSNKENIPPLMNDIAPLAERMDTKPIDPIHTDQLDLNMLDFNDGAMNWFDEMTKQDNNIGNNNNINNNNNNKNTNNHATPTFLFENGNIKFNDLIMDPKTLKFPGSNNNNKETPRDALVEDPDKTSPLDTLSMPLMELEEGSHSAKHMNDNNMEIKKHIPTCKEQLKRLPILAPSQSNLSQHNNSNNNTTINLKKDDRMEEIVGSEATVLLHYNTSPTNTLSNQNSSKTDLQKINKPSNFHSNDEIDDEEKKQNRILPSSPSMIFDYRTNPYHDEENDEANSPDLFTTFINQNQDKANNSSKNNDSDDKFGSDFNEMRHSNDGNYTPATTVHFTSDEK
ncbi:protein Spt21p [Monosporozyma unispora]